MQTVTQPADPFGKGKSSNRKGGIRREIAISTKTFWHNHVKNVRGKKDLGLMKKAEEETRKIKNKIQRLSREKKKKKKSAKKACQGQPEDEGY